MNKGNKILWSIMVFIMVCMSCTYSSTSNAKREDNRSSMIISRAEYHDKLYGFWLGQCIGNWTGLITEMDKIGNIGEIRTGDFYTGNDWGKPDLPNIWSDGTPSDLSAVIDYIIVQDPEIWGADDDTDIEYMYQHLIWQHKNTILTPQQIREGWLKHIRHEEENYLWVSNQQAFDLMREGVLPPQTSNPELNPHFDMIDAQLTTEIFGFFAPARPDIALKLSYLPIRTTARNEAALIAEFYVIMYSLASSENENISIKDQIFDMADQARRHLPDTTYPAAMFDLVASMYDKGVDWEVTRDSLYQRFQVEESDGYDVTSRNLYCNGCFAAGINFGASIISLLYGGGDLKETIKIGTLCGWDSDNPTATWAGLIGFMIGKNGIEEAFKKNISGKFHIHRTRQNFPDNGIDTFEEMAKKGVLITDMVVRNQMKGIIDLENGKWIIPIDKLSSKN